MSSTSRGSVPRGGGQGDRTARASQVWRTTISTGEYQRVAADRAALRSPLWWNEKESLLLLGNHDGVFNLCRRDAHGEQDQLTHFDHGALVDPAVAEEAGVVVFRHLFDLYRLNLHSAGGPEKVSLVCRTDRTTEPLRRRLTEASDVAFTRDGLEIAMIAGGDLWVMDTVLREPRQVTATPGAESSPGFSPDGEKIVFAGEVEGQADIYLAERARPQDYWWRNHEFRVTKLTDDAAADSRPQFSPSGDRVAFVRGRGDLCVMTLEDKSLVTVRTGWGRADFQWSPDGRFLCFAAEDNNFNSDVHVVAADGSSSPMNVSRHADEDRGPVWSPDGTMIAYTGVRAGDETDIFIAHLDAPPPSDRFDQIAEALDTIRRARRPESEETADPEPAAISPNFDDLEEQVVRIRNPGVTESRLIWGPDSKRLAFVGYDTGERATYVLDVDEPDDPERVGSSTGSRGVWSDDAILWLSGDTPARFDVDRGKQEKYGFRAYQIEDAPAHNTAVFLHCWRLIRDNFYDATFHGADWGAVRERYLSMASEAVDLRMLGDLVKMMVGELNASHQGFTVRSDNDPRSWADQTAHLGCWFADDLTIERTAPNAREAGLAPGDRMCAWKAAP